MPPFQDGIQDGANINNDETGNSSDAHFYSENLGYNCDGSDEIVKQDGYQPEDDIFDEYATQSTGKYYICRFIATPGV